LPHPKAKTNLLYVRTKGSERGLLQIKVTYKAQITNTPEYLNTKHKEDQRLSIISNHGSNQSNTNPRIETAAKVV
jgi:hypothetical protein